MQCGKFKKRERERRKRKITVSEIKKGKKAEMFSSD